MNTNAPGQGSASERARARLLRVPGEPLFLADWLRAVFIHFEIEPATLQREIPCQLDLWEGRAHVSLVAFEMAHLRPRVGGRLGALLCAPIANHAFFNVRTYVRHGSETGIYFMTEWVSNPLSVPLGPRTYGLPYRFGKLQYRHRQDLGEFEGRIGGARCDGRVTYSARSEPGTGLRPCAAGTMDEFLLERYTAFTCCGDIGRFFRIWHEPWAQTPLRMEVPERSLLASIWPWFEEARLIGAHYSSGVEGVWMGWPHRRDFSRPAI